MRSSTQPVRDTVPGWLVRMRCSCLLLTASLLSVCASLVLVILFIYIFVVPHVILHDFIHTMCYIVKIELAVPDTKVTYHQRLTWADSHLYSSESWTRINTSSTCVFVSVKYKTWNGKWKYGTLYLDTSAYDNRRSLGKVSGHSNCRIKLFKFYQFIELENFKLTWFQII